MFTLNTRLRIGRRVSIHADSADAGAIDAVAVVIMEAVDSARRQSAAMTDLDGCVPSQPLHAYCGNGSALNTITDAIIISSNRDCHIDLKSFWLNCRDCEPAGKGVSDAA
jgi:hypothetical protein